MFLFAIGAVAVREPLENAAHSRYQPCVQPQNKNECNSVPGCLWMDFSTKERNRKYNGGSGATRNWQVSDSCETNVFYDPDFAQPDGGWSFIQFFPPLSGMRNSRIVGGDIMTQDVNIGRNLYRIDCSDSSPNVDGLNFVPGNTLTCDFRYAGPSGISFTNFNDYGYGYKHETPLLFYVRVNPTSEDDGVYSLPQIISSNPKFRMFKGYEGGNYVVVLLRPSKEFTLDSGESLFRFTLTIPDYVADSQGEGVVSVVGGAIHGSQVRSEYLYPEDVLPTARFRSYFTVSTPLVRASQYFVPNSVCTDSYCSLGVHGNGYFKSARVSIEGRQIHDTVVPANVRSVGSNPLVLRDKSSPSDSNIVVAARDSLPNGLSLNYIEEYLRVLFNEDVLYPEVRIHATINWYDAVMNEEHVADLDFLHTFETCSGVPFPGASLCANDNINVPMASRFIQYVNQCTIRKCEYQCPEGNVPSNDGTNCVSPAVVFLHPVPEGRCFTFPLVAGASRIAQQAARNAGGVAMDSGQVDLSAFGLQLEAYKRSVLRSFSLVC